MTTTRWAIYWEAGVLDVYPTEDDARAVLSTLDPQCDQASLACTDEDNRWVEHNDDTSCPWIDYVPEGTPEQAARRFVLDED